MKGLFALFIIGAVIWHVPSIATIGIGIVVFWLLGRFLE